MSDQHFTYFKVENFKRFDSLELTDIGQFNLVVGDNNVGKTSVLEALLVNFDRRTCLLNFHKTLDLKGISIRPRMSYGPKGEVVDVQYPEENFLRYIFKTLDKTLVFRFTPSRGEDEIYIRMTDPPKVQYDEFRGSYYDTHFTGVSPDNRYIEFGRYWPPASPEHVEHYIHEEIHEDVIIDKGYDEEIAGLYEHLLSQNIQQGDWPLISTSLPNSSLISKRYFDHIGLSRTVKRQLIADMKFVLPKLEDIEVIKINGEDQLFLGMEGQDEFIPLAVFGESVSRVVYILLEIHKHTGKRLMIDEIDTGIHYSRMKEFLKQIVQTAVNNNVQLFLTTHSLECQEAFTEVFEMPDMVQHKDKVRQYTLIEKSDGQVVANKFNFNQLENALEIGFDTRGGERG